MAKPSKSSKKSAGSNRDASFSPFLFATVDENGIVPDSRVPNSNNGYTLCKNLKLKNLPREIKWSSIFRCYNLFPPNSYSQEAAKELNSSSNVPFGQMYYRVNNRKSSYYDLVTQRNQAATITTKKGNENERTRWGDLISTAWDRALRGWESYLYNNELTIQEMNLNGKGFEWADSPDGWFTTSLLNSQVLIPENTYADLRNLGHVCLKRSYTPLEFWKKIRNEKYAKQAGWNFWACVDAIRYFTTNNYYFKTPTEFLHSINAGSTFLDTYDNVQIHLYELYVMEYDGSITKTVQLQNYGPIVDGYNAGRTKPSEKITDEEYRDKAGYLFSKKNWAKEWSELITPFTCSTGSGFWHEIKGYGEGIYTQCRAHDIHMNKLMNAVLINNTFILEGGSADATQKLKRMEWYLGGMQILPTDVKAIQNRFEMPTQETMAVMQYYVGEMDRGTGTYIQNSANKNGAQRTLGEAQLDAAENTKLQGTELRAYNASQTRWQKQLYKRFLNCTRGGEGYELKEKFMEFLKDNEVPEEAYQWKNIDTFESNLLGGAGSPSYRAIVGEKLIAASQIVPLDDFQKNAKEDYIAALTDRVLVSRYCNTKINPIPKEIWEIGQENASLTDENCNPENVRVLPDQNHIEHLKGHYSDAVQIYQRVKQQIDTQQADSDYIKDGFLALTYHLGHMGGHMQFLEKDATKKDMYKQFVKALDELTGFQKELQGAYSQMQESEQQQQGGQGGMSPEDVKLHAMVAQEAIRTKALQDKENIKLGATANKHQLQEQTKQESAANQLAIQRAQAAQQAQIQQQQANLNIGTQAVQATQDLAIQQAQAEEKLKSTKKINAKKKTGK